MGNDFPPALRHGRARFHAVKAFKAETSPRLKARLAKKAQAHHMALERALGRPIAPLPADMAPFLGA